MQRAEHEGHSRKGVMIPGTLNRAGRARPRSVPTVPLGQTVLFLVLLSGPPKFRFRDAEASLYGELDLATILNVLVWCVGGFWVAWQVWQHASGKRPALKLTATHLWAMVFIALLGVSTTVSLAPALSAFKVYQAAVLFGLGLVFVQRYGAAVCFDRLFVGNLLLCGLIVFFLVVTPDLVLFESETGAMRLRGRGVGELGIVAAIAIILLFATRKRLFSPMTVAAFAGLGLLLFYSLMRTAYLVVAIFFLMWWLKRAKGRRLVPAVAVVAILLVAATFGWIPDLEQYRDPESIWTLSDRVGLWAHFIVRTMEESPWLGLGFVSGVRVVGMEFNPELGTGHSIFFEAFVGGGLLALGTFLVLIALLTRDAAWLFFRSRDRLAFAGCALFMAALLFGFIGGELDAGQLGFPFWMLVSLLPYLRRRGDVELALGREARALVPQAQGV